MTWEEANLDVVVAVERTAGEMDPGWKEGLCVLTRKTRPSAGMAGSSSDERRSFHEPENGLQLAPSRSNPHVAGLGVEVMNSMGVVRAAAVGRYSCGTH